MSVMFTCRELVELVSAYLDGELSWLDRMRFRAHVAMCPDCAAWLEQMEATTAALGRAPDLEIPPAIQTDMLEAFERWTAEGEG